MNIPKKKPIKRIKFPKQKPIEIILESFPEAVLRPNGFYFTDCSVCNKNLLKFRENGKGNVHLRCGRGCLVSEILKAVGLPLRTLYHDRKIPNKNAPGKGSIIRTEPIKSLDDVNRIRELLENQPRNLCYWILGCNTNLRTIDLCKLKVWKVREALEKKDGILEIRESKTKKVRRTKLNQLCVNAIKKLLASKSMKDDDYLLMGRKGEKFTTVYAGILIKKWTKTLGIAGHFGAHTPRRTFGFHQYHTFKKSLPMLMIALNHSSQRETLKYIGIQDVDVDALFDNEI